MIRLSARFWHSQLPNEISTLQARIRLRGFWQEVGEPNVVPMVFKDHPEKGRYYLRNIDPYWFVMIHMLYIHDMYIIKNHYVLFTMYI